MIAGETAPRLSYAPARESTPVNVAASYGHFIDGAFVRSSGGETFATSNPATGAVLAQVASGTAADVDRAVAAARAAYERVWQRLSPARRAAYLYRIARAISERSRELAVLETLDNGKPIKESRDFDVPAAAAHFFYYAGWAERPCERAAWPERSCPGTFRCSWLLGRSRRRWRPGTRWC
jgi:acyl-CoA reductase-like NAD-dependent aldehyde dehydrogenase